MRYFAEIITLTEVKLYAVDKKGLIDFYNQHPNAKCLGQEEYEKLNVKEDLPEVVLSKAVEEGVNDFWEQVARCETGN